MRRVEIIGILIIAAILCGMAQEIGGPKEPDKALVAEDYVVSEGDTLWGIARQFCPAGVDIRENILELQRRNGLAGAVIREGQTLEVYTLKGAEIFGDGGKGKPADADGRAY